MDFSFLIYSNFIGYHIVGIFILGLTFFLSHVQGYGEGLSKKNIGGIVLWEIWAVLFILNCIIKFIKYSVKELVKSIIS